MSDHSSEPQIRSILKTLIMHPHNFTAEQAHQALHEIMSGLATPAQISAFLVACRLHRKDADPVIIASCGKVMQEHAVHVHFHDQALAEEIVDIVGTGGDGHNTFNVSTTAAIVAAGAGCKVAKHGNRASSSSSGSADFLESYGCALTNVTSDLVPGMIAEHNFCFLFAEKYHPAMKNASKPRREIGVPTIFNILGPMSNPAKPKRSVVGVHSKWVGEFMIEALKLSGAKRAMVVCGAEGLDEISPAGETFTWTLSEDGQITFTAIHPTHDFGLQTHTLDSVRGGGPADNVQTLERLLANELPENNPILDFVLLNAAAVLVVAKKAQTFKEGVEIARAAIIDGRAKAALEGFKNDTQARN
ncbi:anthranilate phosphoribosyltransferase [Jimgerdemannia flammicorona]|uniref:Anthranilate phosphoribosyltransferase n=1 Tax=Jimgerdemannia flammicorona TaxID=994334 RepID=A0A433DJZ9_9FUNG|nr:anthranilate phosphoribosyltransferase [Jimgerdemannia flammicorona]